MPEHFLIQLSDLQPSQLYVSAAKLAAVRRLGAQRPEPLPVKELAGRLVLTDGHTRAVAAYLAGAVEIPVQWETDALDWEAYETCVDWCLDAGLRALPDLAQHVIDPEQYEELWIERCRVMHEQLARVRAQEGGSGS